MALLGALERLGSCSNHASIITKHGHGYTWSSSSFAGASRRLELGIAYWMTVT
jgi:hypothetical protein